MIARHAQHSRREIKDQTTDKIDVHCLLHTFRFGSQSMHSSVHSIFFFFSFLSFLTARETERRREKESTAHIFALFFRSSSFSSLTSFVCYWCHIKAKHASCGCSSVNFICTLCSGLKEEFVLLLLPLLQSKRKTTTLRTLWLYFSFIHFYTRLFHRILNMCVAVFLVSRAQKIEME